MFENRHEAGIVETHTAKSVVQMIHTSAEKDWFDGTTESLDSRRNELTELIGAVESCLHSNKADYESPEFLALHDALPEIREEISNIDSAIEQVAFIQGSGHQSLASVAEVRPFDQYQSPEDAGLTLTADRDRYEALASLNDEYFAERESEIFAEEHLASFEDRDFFRDSAIDFAMTATADHDDASLRSQIISLFVENAEKAAERLRDNA